MPCYRCAARQDDPGRGPSPWRRGVRGNEQVLVCPGCQRAHEWAADLDRCASCGSIALVKVLGETRCRDCGATGAGVPAPGATAGVARDERLAADVAAALERVLRRPQA